MEITDKVANIVVKPGKVSDWRKNPGDVNAAARAAAHYAKRNGEPIVLIQGNSYGARVVHLARITDSVASYNPGASGANVIVVDIDGQTYNAIAY